MITGGPCPLHAYNTSGVSPRRHTASRDYVGALGHRTIGQGPHPAQLGLTAAVGSPPGGHGPSAEKPPDMRVRDFRGLIEGVFEPDCCAACPPDEDR